MQLNFIIIISPISSTAKQRLPLLLRHTGANQSFPSLTLILLCRPPNELGDDRPNLIKSKLLNPIHKTLTVGFVFQDAEFIYHVVRKPLGQMLPKLRPDTKFKFNLTLN